jgi:hypothetical protein
MIHVVTALPVTLLLGIRLGWHPRGR